jgi:hypothetical protein
MNWYLGRTAGRQCVDADLWSVVVDVFDSDNDSGVSGQRVGTTITRRNRQQVHGSSLGSTKTRQAFYCSVYRPC